MPPIDPRHIKALVGGKPVMATAAQNARRAELQKLADEGRKVAKRCVEIREELAETTDSDEEAGLRQELKWQLAKWDKLRSAFRLKETGAVSILHPFDRAP